MGFFFGDMAKGSRSNRSRKGKKAWRKNVDVTDVEDVARLRSTTNEQLFVVDKPVRAPVLSRKARKQLISSRTLYSDAISTPIGKNKHTTKPKNTPADQRLERIAQQLARLTEKPSPVQTPVPTAAPTFDLWGSDDIKPSRKKKSPSAQGVLKSSMSIVQPGQSYRPRHEDHQNLLSLAMERVDASLRPEIEAAKKITPTALRTPDVEVKWNYSDSENEEDEDQQDLDRDHPIDHAQQIDELEKNLGRHYSMKFTRTQRNKMKRKKELMLQHRRALREQRQNQVFERMEEMISTIAEEEEVQQKKVDDRQQLRAAREQTKKLGKLRYQEKPVDFLYTDELPTSLRSLKPSNNLAYELFNNFEKRNMLEPRKPKHVRYHAIKFRETRMARDFNASVGL